MKKLLQHALAATLLLSTGVAHAQLSAGHWLVGGNAGFSSTTPEDRNSSRTTTITEGSFSPRVGYFVADNLVVGLDLLYSGRSEKLEINSTASDTSISFVLTRTQKNRSLLVGPFVRYYKPISEKAAFFGHLSLGFGSQKTTVEYEGKDAPPEAAREKDIKYSRVSAALQPGFTYFFTPRFGLELTTTAIGLGYNRSRLKEPLPTGANEDDYTSSGFYAQADLRNLINPSSWLIGASFYLGGK